MAERKPVVINQIPTQVDGNATISDVVPINVTSILNRQGQVIPRSDFERTPLPESFETNLTEIDKGAYDKSTLLALEVYLIESDINQFTNPQNLQRVAWAGDSGNYIRVQNFPLPNGFKPDSIDLIVVTSDYPSFPPVGLHIAKTDSNDRIIKQIEKAMQGHIYDGAAIDPAEEISGYHWVCYHFRNHQWQFAINNPTQGDNISKFLKNFFALLEGQA